MIPRQDLLDMGSDNAQLYVFKADRQLYCAKRKEMPFMIRVHNSQLPIFFLTGFLTHNTQILKSNRLWSV